MLMAETPESPPSSEAPGSRWGKTGMRLATTSCIPRWPVHRRGRGGFWVATPNWPAWDRAARQVHGMPGRLVATPGGCSGNTALPRWLGFGLTGMPQAGGNGGNTDADDRNGGRFACCHPRLVRGPKPGAIRASLFSALSRKRSRVCEPERSIAPLLSQVTLKPLKVHRAICEKLVSSCIADRRVLARDGRRIRSGAAAAHSRIRVALKLHCCLMDGLSRRRNHAQGVIVLKFDASAMTVEICSGGAMRQLKGHLPKLPCPVLHLS